jgi:hypothetical protein
LSPGVVRVRPDRLRHAGTTKEAFAGSVRPAEAESSLEVGDRVYARQTRQRQAVQVAAAARHSRTSQAQTFRLARGSVELSGIALSSKTHGKDFQNVLLVTTMYIVEKEALDLMKVGQ